MGDLCTDPYDTVHIHLRFALDDALRSAYRYDVLAEAQEHCEALA